MGITDLHWFCELDWNWKSQEIKEKSEPCALLSKQIVQMADDFDLDGIQKLADDLDAC